MASLPADRTKLALAQTNQVPNMVIASAKNINAVVEAYDTIDLLNQKVDTNYGTGAIGTSQLATDAVTLAKMADSSVGTTELVAASVTLAKMAAASVGTSQLVDLSVTNAKIANATLDSTKFVAGALNNDTQNGLLITAISTDITQRVINVKSAPYNAKGDGVTDDSAAITAAIAAAALANAQTGSASRVTVFFPAGVYLCKSTITFSPFINYVGLRATTADTDSSFTTYSSSRGSIIRAHTSLYTGTPAGAGVMVYVPTGDITFENLSFVGTAAINSNSSIGIQWGSTGGVANSGRPYETDGTGQNVGGVSIRNCTFYTFTKAWECNALTDTYGWGNRFESCTTNIALKNNTVTSSVNQIELHGTVQYGHSIGVQIDGSATAEHRLKLIGGSFEGVTNSAKHFSYVGATSPLKVTIRCVGVDLSHTSNTSTDHIFFNGVFDSGTWNVDFDACRFKASAINLTRASGTAPCSNVRFNDCFSDTVASTYSNAKYIKINGGKMEASTITATNTTKCTVQNAEIYNVATFITVAANDCGNWTITGNEFETVTTPISLNAHPTNAGWIVENNQGLQAWNVLTAGATVINVQGTNGFFTSNNSSATTILNFSNGYQGQIVRLVFADGATTLNFSGGGNLKGNGGVNKTFTTADFVTAIYNGTNWLCTF